MPIIIRPLVLFHHGPRHYFCWLAVISCLTQDIVYSIIYSICGVFSRFSNCIILKTYSYVHSYVISVDVNGYSSISDNIIIPYGHVIFYLGRIFICSFSKNIFVNVQDWECISTCFLFSQLLLWSMSIRNSTTYTLKYNTYLYMIQKNQY